ncbi:MAG: NusG domain II-containing protein [Spirochaetales bacterium]|nr:NusG domain II-containing protein [Spirochaetales bacterium]
MKLRIFDVIALIFSLGVFLLFTIYGRSVNQDEGYVIIETEDDQLIYPLSEDRDIRVEGPVGESLIRIDHGTARFESSDCDDDLCVHMGEIHGAGEWAACLPNRVFLYTGGNEDDREVDAGVY